jgi:hypothetical protein
MTWTEPTRRLTFSPRFTYEGHYGASLVALLLGGYLLLNTNLSQLALGLSGRAAFPPEQVVVFLLQYLFAVGVVLLALALAPASPGRRVGAVVVTLILILLWTILFSARITGTAGPLPTATGFIAAPSFIVPLAAVTGWLIVRERPGLSYLVLLLSIIGGAVPFALVLNSMPSVVTQLLLGPLTLVLGVGMAWIARAIAAAYGSRFASDEYIDAPPAV